MFSAILYDLIALRLKNFSFSFLRSINNFQPIYSNYLQRLWLYDALVIFNTNIHNPETEGKYMRNSVFLMYIIFIKSISVYIYIFK